MTLTATEVYEIRQFYDEGWTRHRGNSAAIARAYGIAQNYVYAIGQRAKRLCLPEEDDRDPEARPRHALTCAQVRQIRRFFDQGMARDREMLRLFARRFDRTRYQIELVGRRKSYLWVPEEAT